MKRWEDRGRQWKTEECRVMEGSERKRNEEVFNGE